MIPFMSATAGATMLGEGRGIEDAARRGREKRRQREEAARATAERDSLSGTTKWAGDTETGDEKAKLEGQKVHWESRGSDKDTARPQKSVRNWIRENILLEAPR